MASHIKLTFCYEPHLTKLESRPMIRFYTSAQKAPRNKMVDVVAVPGTDHDVLVPADFGRHAFLRRGDMVCAQVYTKIQSAEGFFLYQKDGAAVFFLDALIKTEQAEQVRHSEKDDPEHTHYDIVPVHAHKQARVPKGEVSGELDLQSMMIYKKKIVKGKLHLRIHTRFSEDAFRPPSLSDSVPQNMGLLNALVRASVDKSMALFDPKQQEALGVKFEATQPELNNLCAPYWVSVAGVLPGAMYWTNVNGMDPWPEPVIHDTLMEVLGRHDMTETMFSSKLNSALNDFDDMDTIVESAAILGEVVCAPSSTVHYLADVRFVHAAEMSDSKIARPSTLHRPSKVVRVTVENFAKDGPSDLMGGVNADDCEGTANFNGECFRSIRDGEMSKSGTKALQRLAHMYAAAGTLVTVTSANVSEDDKKKTSTESTIGSDADRSMKPGAHERLDLIPKRVVAEWAMRVSPSEKDTLEWSDGTLMHTIPDEQRKLPILICEGTGNLYPLFLADEAYQSSPERKVTAIEKQAYRRETFTRMLFGQTSIQLKKRGKFSKEQINAEKMFSTYGQFMRGKNTNRNITNNPDVRGPFYRMPARMLFLPEKKDPINVMLGNLPESEEDTITSSMDASRLQASFASIIGDSVSSRGAKKQRAEVEVRIPRLHWLETIPVTCGSRPSHFTDEAYDRVPSYASFDSMTRGTNTMDELNKQPYVGLLRLPAFTTEEMIAIRSISRNVPPTPAVKPMGEDEHIRLNKLEHRIAGVIKDTMHRHDKIAPMSTNSQVISYWMRTPDVSDKKVADLAEHAASNPYILAVEVHVERFAHTMSVVRFDFLTNMVGWKGIHRAKAEQSIVKHSSA